MNYDMRPRPLPRKRWLLLRLAVLFIAVALAVGLQAGEGEAAGHRESPSSTPSAPDAGCMPPVGLRHPAVPGADQPRAARSSDASNTCSRPARSGS